MKKVLIISALDIWSMGKHKGAPSLLQTLKGYADRGWKVFFVTGNKNKGSVYNIHKNIKIIRFDAKILKTNVYFRKTIGWLYFQIRTFFEGYKIAKKENIDVFYGYELHGIPSAKILSKIFKKPLISRFQGTKLTSRFKGRLWRLKYWNDILAMKISTDLLIMTNDGTKGDWMLKKLRVDMRKVKFWLNGINKDTFISNFNDKDRFRKEIDIPVNQKILLTVSRLERWKRVDRVIRAIPQVIKGCNNIVLLVIGDGKEKKELESLVKQLKIEDYVKFLGSIEHRLLKNYYNAADIFFSMYDDSNVGNPLLEAMVCGKCIIALDIGDTNKFISDNHTGILLRMEELSKLPKIIVNLLEDNEKRKELGINARDFANKNFWTWEKRIDAEIKEVEKILEE